MRKRPTVRSPKSHSAPGSWRRLSQLRDGAAAPPRPLLHGRVLIRPRAPAGPPRLQHRIATRLRSRIRSRSGLGFILPTQDLRWCATEPPEAIMNGRRRVLTLFEKIWRKHAILEREDGQTLLYVDNHFLQDGSAPAFELLRQRGLQPRVPRRSFATPDHYVPTDSRDLASIADPEKRAMAEALRRDSAAAGIAFFGLDDAR